MPLPGSSLISTAGSYTWPPIVNLSRRAVISALSKIETGQLVITESSTNVVTVCGALEPKLQNGTDVKDRENQRKGMVNGAKGKLSTVKEGPRVGLRVMSDMFWVRMVLFADMGFAESYMLGEVACEDLTSFFEIFILNRSALSNGITLVSSLSALLTRVARSTNTLTNARLNISAHYDISNAMFASFLSPDMTYSCPIWSPLSSSASHNEPLEVAQDTKLQYFIDQAKIQPDDHVLEIGSGWGSFAIAAVKRTGCRVTTLTLSEEQKTLADQRIAAVGLSNRIQVLLCDYRALPNPPEGYYDKLVSIEMLEAVGAEYLGTYFGCVDRLLKPDDGIAVFQCITIPETRYETYKQGQDFIRKYIFPGGHLPTVSLLTRSIDEGSQGRLQVEGVRNIGGHYAKALRVWGEEFRKNWDEIRQTLEREKGVGEEDAEVFRRKWEYYFTYCEAGFRTKTLGDAIVTVTREGTTALLDDIPL